MRGSTREQLLASTRHGASLVQLIQVTMPLVLISVLTAVLDPTEMASYLQYLTGVGLITLVTFGFYETILLRADSLNSFLLDLTSKPGVRVILTSCALTTVFGGIWTLEFVRSSLWASVGLTVCILAYGLLLIFRATLIFARKYFAVIFLGVGPVILTCGYVLLRQEHSIHVLSVWAAHTLFTLLVAILVSFRQFADLGKITLTWSRCRTGGALSERRPSFVDHKTPSGREVFSSFARIAGINSAQFLLTGWTVPVLRYLDIEGTFEPLVTFLCFSSLGAATLSLSIAVKQQNYEANVHARSLWPSLLEARRASSAFLLAIAVASFFIFSSKNGFSWIWIDEFILVIAVSTVNLSMCELALLKFGYIRRSEEKPFLSSVGCGAALIVPCVAAAMVLSAYIGLVMACIVVRGTVLALEARSESGCRSTVFKEGA